MNLVNILALSGLGVAAVAATRVLKGLLSQTSTSPSHRLDLEWWKERHVGKLAASSDSECKLLFVGDSITHGWEEEGKEVWAEYYGHRKAFNLGYSGDRTENVLWRLYQGEMDHFKPKVAVVMIGTNNTGQRYSEGAEGTAEGVRAVVDLIRAKSPDTKILLLSVFPRGWKSFYTRRQRNNELNSLISQFHDGDKVHYLDIAPAFLHNGGSLSPDVMPDLLHPNKRGYQIWAQSMEPKLKELLGEV